MNENFDSVKSGKKPATVSPIRPQSRFNFKPLSEIVKKHPGTRTWWIRNYIPACAVVLIYGDPACGKTTLATDIVCHIANKLDWRGNTTKSGSILYVAAEDYYGARLRMESWFKQKELSAEIDLIQMLDIPIILADEKDVDELIAVINTMSVKPASIVIDTLALSMGKYSENNDMQLFCNGATRIKTQTGVTVIVIHHCGHGDKTRGRGGSQLPANADVIYQIQRDNDDCTMKCQKMKNGTEPAALSWRMVSQATPWADEDGLPITSVVLEATDTRKREPTPNQQVALDVLKDMVRQQAANLANSGHDPSSARVSVADWKKALIPAIAAKTSRHDVHNDLNKLGFIKIDGLYVSLA